MEPFSKLSSANKRSAEIVAQIKAHLLNGTLKPGDKLPTEEELVEQFGVSRTPIREAIKTLEAIGIVQIKRGEGMFITKQPTSDSLNPLIFSLLLLNESLDKLIEFRQHFEVLMMNVIKSNWSEEKIAKIRQVYESQKETLASDISIENLVEIDLTFHYAILDTTENEYIIEIGKTIYELYKPKMLQAKHTCNVEKTLKAHKYHLELLSSKEPLTQMQIDEMIKYNKEWIG